VQQPPAQNYDICNCDADDQDGRSRQILEVGRLEYHRKGEGTKRWGMIG
jgi:hypothetical protein